ncbi:NUMOD4 domain-containing protein [Bacillus cereus group sp. BceL310]|uniref:NUMOD4 domain-containing protein n=1 Tax=Bacillus cereus group sp. BceL310 TaxID=3444975 RepID=UPI003EC83686
MEIWRDIEGYEGLYQVSNLGRVRSLKKNKMIMKPFVNEEGYLRITLLKDRKKNNLRVHRLVAKAFIYNKDNKPEVNHINAIKSDNKVNNLEWVTPKENMKHANDLGLIKRRKRKVI